LRDTNPDSVAAVALVHERINPLLLADGYTQDAADQVLARITHDLCAAAKRAAPHERGDVATHFVILPDGTIAAAKPNADGDGKITVEIGKAEASNGHEGEANPWHTA
jgi:hypothetical protein